MKKRHLLSLLALGISTACYGETYPAPIGPSQSDFGGVGLLQTPTARMAREGELSLNYRDNDQYRYYSASVQLFPWLETTLRYTDVRTRQYSSVEAFSGDQTYKDKAFDLKLRLWEESYWLPQVAVGARDIGGTGLFDAEYLGVEFYSIGKSILAQADANPWQAALDYAMIYFLAVWKAAVLGVILGSLIQVLIPRDWLLRTLGQSRFRGTLLGTLFSLPGKMCTCCAAPVAAGMRRQQVSMGGALAFWMGNPLLNPATLVFMGFVLGWGFAAIRLVAGLVMVLLIATLVQKWVRETPQTQAPVEIDIPESQGGFFSRWGRALWTLFWSTIPGVEFYSQCSCDDST